MMKIVLTSAKRVKPQPRNGQGLVEYAIILALVAVVAIVVLGLVGLATSRVFGIVGGAVGVKNDVHDGATFIYFDSNQPPQCGYLPAQDATGLYAQFYSSIAPTALTVSTDTGFVTTVTTSTSGTCTPATPCYMAAQPILAMGNNPGICPHSIVIQSSKETGGQMAIYPVKVENWP